MTTLEMYFVVFLFEGGDEPPSRLTAAAVPSRLLLFLLFCDIFVIYMDILVIY